MKKLLQQNLAYFVFVVALFSSLASLYASEILKLPPCSMCWYQRIAMYPIVPVAIVGILLKDKKLPYYILPLSIGGFLLAIYHNLLVWNVIPEAVAPCVVGVPCNVQEVFFGFITIPLLSMLSFAFITVCMVISIMSFRQKPKHDTRS